MEEIWKDIPDYEGYYQVSNLGRVKSLERVILVKNYSKTIKEKFLKNRFVGLRGYAAVMLCKDTQKSYLVHRLVYETFVEKIDNDLIIDHIDNNPTNNKLDNLQMITHRLNMSKDVNKQKTSSKYTGVCWNKKYKKWRSRIVVNKKTIHLGMFENEYDAHLTYQKKLKDLKNKTNI